MVELVLPALATLAAIRPAAVRRVCHVSPGVASDAMQVRFPSCVYNKCGLRSPTMSATRCKSLQRMFCDPLNFLRAANRQGLMTISPYSRASPSKSASLNSSEYDALPRVSRRAVSGGCGKRGQRHSPQRSPALSPVVAYVVT